MFFFCIFFSAAPTLTSTLFFPSKKKTQLGMMASFLLAYRVDSAVARQQRRDLGLCEACGGLNERGSCREKGCPMK